MVKVLNGVNLLPVVAFFLPVPLQYAAGVLPAYWPMRAFWSAAAGEDYLTSRKAAVALQLWSFPATMLRFGMLKYLFALVFLALAVSPFTAPFQTCADATAAAVAPFNNEDEPGSLVSPLVTKAGRLTVSVAPPAGLGVSYFVPLASLTPFIPPTSHIRHDSIRPTVLRV